MSASGRQIAHLILLTIVGWHGPAADKALAQHPTAHAKPDDQAHSQFGTLMRFARTVPRPAIPQDAITRGVAMSPITLQSVDQRQILTEGMSAHARIADPARVERAFGRGEAAWDSVSRRIQVGLADELRRSIGRRTLPELASFDPFVIVNDDTQLARTLAGIGLAIDDVDGDAMGYRTWVAR
jgi:hypothetical protein